MRDYSVLDNLEEGVQIISHEFKYIYLNKILLSEIHMTKEEMIGYYMNDKFHGIDQLDIYKEIGKSLKEKCITKFINEFKFPDGRKTFYEIKIQPIEEGVILFTRDITKTERGVQLLRETNRELEQFAFVSAHNLREPIKLIESFSDLLLTEYKENLPKEVLSICEKIYSKSKLSLQLVNEFRDLSGIGATKLAKEKFSIIELAKTISAPLLKDYPHKNIEISFSDIDSSVYAYKSLVSILMRHLFKNVIDYGKDKVSFLVISSEEQIYCFTNLTDDGAKTEDVFSSEFMLGKSNYSALGRAICKKVINQHNGKIWSEQSGNIFKVFFKLAVAKA